MVEWSLVVVVLTWRRWGQPARRRGLSGFLVETGGQAAKLSSSRQIFLPPSLMSYVFLDGHPFRTLVYGLNVSTTRGRAPTTGATYVGMLFGGRVVWVANNCEEGRRLPLSRNEWARPGRLPQQDLINQEERITKTRDPSPKRDTR